MIPLASLGGLLEDGNTAKYVESEALKGLVISYEGRKTVPGLREFGHNGMATKRITAPEMIEIWMCASIPIIDKGAFALVYNKLRAN